MLQFAASLINRIFAKVGELFSNDASSDNYRMSYEEWSRQRMTEAVRTDLETGEQVNNGLLSPESKKKYADYISREKQEMKEALGEKYKEPASYQERNNKYNSPVRMVSGKLSDGVDFGTYVESQDLGKIKVKISAKDEKKEQMSFDQDDKMSYDEWRYRRSTETVKFNPKTKKFSNSGIYSPESEKKFADYIRMEEEGVIGDVTKGSRECLERMEKRNQARLENVQDSNEVLQVKKLSTNEEHDEKMDVDRKKKAVKFNEEKNEVKFYVPGEKSAVEKILHEAKGLKAGEIKSYYRDKVVSGNASGNRGGGRS